MVLNDTNSASGRARVVKHRWSSPPAWLTHTWGVCLLLQCPGNPPGFQLVVVGCRCMPITSTNLENQKCLWKVYGFRKACDYFLRSLRWPPRRGKPSTWELSAQWLLTTILWGPGLASTFISQSSEIWEGDLQESWHPQHESQWVGSQLGS